MRSAADKPRGFNAAHFVLWPLVQHLSQRVRQIERGAKLNSFGGPIIGRDMFLGADAAADIANSKHSLKLVQRSFAQGCATGIPVHVIHTWLRVGRGHQNVQRAVSARRHRSVKARWIADIHGWILAQHAIAGNVAQILLILSAGVNGVVGEVQSRRPLPNTS